MTEDQIFYLSRVKMYLYLVTLQLWLAKCFICHWTNVTEFIRQYLLSTNLQLINFWGQLDLTWLPETTGKQ